MSPDIVLFHMNASSNGYSSSGAATATMRKIIPKDNKNNTSPKTNIYIKNHQNTNKHAENKTKKQKKFINMTFLLKPLAVFLFAFFSRNLLVLEAGHLSLQQLLPKVHQRLP